jgi:hypothetical protein
MVFIYIVFNTPGWAEPAKDKTDGRGVEGKLVIDVKPGKRWLDEHTFFWVYTIEKGPQVAVWLENKDKKHLATIFVTRRFALKDWRTIGFSEVSRPEALPIWRVAHQAGGFQGKKLCNACHDLHESNDKSIDKGSGLDAITRATPEAGVKLEWNPPEGLPKGEYLIRAEINHSFDYNEYFPEDSKSSDKNYNKLNGQPSLLWSGVIELGPSGEKVQLKPVGIGDPIARDGVITKDLSKLTTSMEIVDSISVEYLTEK